MPFGMCAVLKKDYVSGAVASWTHRIIFKHDRGFEDQDRFIKIVVPAKLPFATLPDNGRCQPVRTGRQNGALRSRVSFDDPGRLDRSWRSIHDQVSGFNEST